MRAPRQALVFIRLTVISVLLCLCGGIASANQEWVRYKNRFLAEDGRVVDTGNSGVSHSEGQGYGMLLAVAYNDRSAFQRMLAWTDRALPAGPTGLIPWRWVPGQGVTDPNNASDGDILIAWALARAARKWNDSAHATRGRTLAQAVLDHAVRRTDMGPVLMPGASGFEREQGIVLNLSYYVFPAFPELNRLVPSPTWGALAATGARLLEAGRFGRWNLPPDWLEIGPTTRMPANGFKPVYGFNAVRIPLYLAWDASADRRLLDPFLAFWRSWPSPDKVPAEIALPGDQPAEYGAPPGMQAIIGWVASGRRPPDTPDDDYYSATLALLTRLAASERARR